MKEKIRKILSQKKYAVMSVILILGIIFLIGSEYISNGNAIRESAYDQDAYARGLEKRLKEILERVDGVSEVQVMIAVTPFETREAQSAAAVWREERQETSPPEIRGVSVVCRGASDPTVKKKVIDLVKSVLDLESNRIFVTE